MKYRGLFWFSENLRLNDNKLLQKACAETFELIPVFIIEDHWFATDKWGFERVGRYRRSFIAESLLDLKSQLKAMGSDLLILKGNANTLIPQLIDSLEIDIVYSLNIPFSEESTKLSTIEKANLSVTWCKQEPQMLIESNHPVLANQTILKQFTPFKNKIEARLEINEISPLSPQLPKLSNETITRFPYSSHVLNFLNEANKGNENLKGGETSAWNHIEDYIWNTNSIAHYESTRNQLIGKHFSSKFSAYLALGNITASQLYQEISKYEKLVLSNKSTYWLKYELLWREYFYWACQNVGNKLFNKQLPGIHDGADIENLYLWVDGKTDQDFVNANMLELKHTGYLSNRGRQNVASYLIHDLKVDWQAGAYYFESMLIDYSVFSNWGNWNYIAGLHFDPRGGRKFNIEKQQQTYDENLKFTKHWLNYSKG